MRYRTNQKYSFSCTYMILIFILLCISADVVAQQEMTREERIKVLQLLKDNDMELEKGTQHGRGCLAAGKQSYQEIQTPLQRTAERRQDLPVHLRAERIFPPRIQDAENHTQRFFLLRPVQPHTIHVCSARPHQAFVPATHLQLESLARKHPGREVQCMPGIPYQELCRPLHRQAESGRIPQKHRRNKGNTQGKYPGDRADAVSADAGACGGNEV